MNPNFDSDVFVNKAAGFTAPQQLPSTDAQTKRWQEANRAWWEASSMRYDWRESIEEQPGTRAYFAEIDRRFLSSAKHYLPWKDRPFESLVPYASLTAMRVLEIGVGNGTHAQLIAPRCREYVGIDLTDAACDATRARLVLAGINASILRMDAEAMTFSAGEFDFIWSWGVIHHSANTAGILNEMHRVLRPAGRAVVMVYYRSPIQYYLVNGFARGLVGRQFWSVGNIHRINQAATDGALARFFSVAEFRHLLADRFRVERLIITGQKTDAIPLPSGRLKSVLVSRVPDPVTRLLTDFLRLGTFLIAQLKRI